MTAFREEWIPLTSNFHSASSARKQFRALVEKLAELSLGRDKNGDDPLKYVRDEALRKADKLEEGRQELRFIVLALTDLHSKGWRFRADESVCAVRPPDRTARPVGAEQVQQEKDRVRETLLYERDNQLRNASTRDFVQSMEKRHYNEHGWVSVFELMREGRDLAKKLRKAAQVSDEAERCRTLRQVIDPYLQVVDPDEIDPYTELRLGDIWRYFRYTWVSPNLSIPGRKLLLLVRDRAAPSHPVMGIAALGNSIVHQGPRDDWIGWTPAKLIERIASDSSVSWPMWVLSTLNDFIEGVYYNNFLKEKVITNAEIKRPTRDSVKRLRTFGSGNRRQHSLEDTVAEVDREEVTAQFDWLTRARTKLFRSKRANLLALLLDARRVLQELGFDEPTRNGLDNVLRRAVGRQALSTILRRVKAHHIGIDMLEITICGAIQPYNALLGGKLVALLLTSPEVVQAYNARYANACSVIASSIAGKAVVRKPNLVLLGTTSLYGVGSSQYNRIVLPAEGLGGRASEMLCYRELGETKGFGCTHFSAQTSEAVDDLIEIKCPERRVKHIFGEGISPRMRSLRVALGYVGFPSQKLLKHDSPRVVYGIALASNFQEVLIGLSEQPDYILPQEEPQEVTRRIGDYWIKRWLSKRIMNEDVLGQVEKHTLVYPIEHGARVPLPKMDEGPTLFSYSEL
jgi:Domain of unknown function (DUF4338)